MAGLKEKLQDSLNKLAEKIEDMATITVVTYTGTLKVTLPAEGPIDLNKCTPVPNQSDLKVVAMTQISADMDTSLVRTNEEVSAELLELHDAAVEGAVTARNDFLKMFIDLL